jgi:hypothetical protein
MGYENSGYQGDAEYPLCCTGDVVVGDEVRFDRATFTGSFRNAKFAGFERITGKVIADSYGVSKQQHTFTLALADGTRVKIKGRNLYANEVYRKNWQDEARRHDALVEKHARGDVARANRDLRKELEREYGHF